MPEALLGGPIALVEDGDKIVIDTEKKTIDWLVDEKEQARRKELWEKSGKGELKVKRGVLKRYARDVQVSRVLFCMPMVADIPCDSLRTSERTAIKR